MRWILTSLLMAFLLAFSVPVQGEEIVPQYNLTGPEREIVVSWLFEPVGYLDVAVNSLGVSARQALQADPSLDVTVWIRNNAPQAGIDPVDWAACGMVWWIWKKNGVNITPPQRPPESVQWIAILQTWAASIDRALIRVNEVARNASTVGITAEDGSRSTMPAGTNLIHQRSLFQKVISVLGG